jgi:hypothetical protein
LGLGQISVNETGVFLINRMRRYSLEGLTEAKRFSSWWGDLEELETSLFFEEIAYAHNTPPQPQDDESGYIDESALTNIQLLGNIDDYQDVPVCYPFNSNMGQKAYGEEEGFKWFMQNDHKEPHCQQVLGLIENAPALPTLESGNHRIELTNLPDAGGRGQMKIWELKGSIKDWLRQSHNNLTICDIELDKRANSAVILLGTATIIANLKGLDTNSLAQRLKYHGKINIKLIEEPEYLE